MSTKSFSEKRIEHMCCCKRNINFTFVLGTLRAKFTRLRKSTSGEFREISSLDT